MHYKEYCNPDLREHAQVLRKEMTKEERHLWYDFLKTSPWQFNRQKVIGNYIVDFYCHKAKLVVELDGSQHFDAAGAEYDRKRDAYLKKNGFLVLRYPNSDIHKNFSGVCEDISRHVQSRVNE